MSTGRHVIIYINLKCWKTMESSPKDVTSSRIWHYRPNFVSYYQKDYSFTWENSESDDGNILLVNLKLPMKGSLSSINKYYFHLEISLFYKILPLVNIKQLFELMKIQEIYDRSCWR